MAGGESAYVARVADEDGGHDGAHPEELSEGGLGRGHRVGDATLRFPHLGVEATQVVEVLEGQGVVGGLDGRGGPDAVEQALGARGVDFIGDTASYEFTQQGVQATGDTVAGSAQVAVALGQEAQHADVVASSH